jgi:hypothetical protein
MCEAGVWRPPSSNGGGARRLLVEFRAARAAFHRHDDEVATGSTWRVLKTMSKSAGDRRQSELADREIDVTSYAEVVLAPGR